MEKITKTFKYALPDEYTGQTSTQKLEGTWTYKGPRYLNLELSNSGINTAVPLASWEDFLNLTEDTETAEENILLDCIDSDHALLATIFYGNQDSDLSDSDVFPHLAVTLPNGQVYKRPNPTAPDHTYDAQRMKWDRENETFKKPYPWFKPFINWESQDIAIANERILYEETKAKASWNDLSADEKAAWDTWDSDLGAISARMKAQGLRAYQYVPTPWPGMPAAHVEDSDG